MGHLLSTTNPVAAARINGEGRPMPGVGETVLYHPRAGEVRQQRKTVPAIVLSVDEGNRHLEILIIHAADDMITQNRVPEHVDGDRGWSRLPGGDAAVIEALENKIAALDKRIELLVLAITGDFLIPEGETVMSLLDKLDGRVADIEEAPVKVTAAGDVAVRTPAGMSLSDKPPVKAPRAKRRRAKHS